MKRYILFAGSQYYPAGGWEDFIEFFDYIGPAKERGKQKAYDWYHIVDTTTWKVVSEC